MATLTTYEPGGEREFVAPFDAPPVPDWFKTGRAELVLRTAPPGDRPIAVSLRCYPLAFEFQVWAPRLVERHGLGIPLFELAHGLDQGAPVVTLTATPALIARLADTACPTTLEDLGDYLQAHPALFEAGGYVLDDVAFERFTASSPA